MEHQAYLQMSEVEARHWWFTARRRILEDQVAVLTEGRDCDILEIGCGTGGNLEMLSGFGRVHALELSAIGREMALSKAGHFSDIRAGSCPDDIPFAPHSFDLVCMFDVLEHIDRDVDTLVALRGLLASSGKALITVPANPWMWGTHDRFLHHKRRYSARSLRIALEAAGLEIDRLTHFNTLLFPVAAASRLKDRFVRSETTSGTGIPPRPINSILDRVFGSEVHLLRSMNLPFGVSLMVIVRPGGQ